jgi:hypothetical protein
MLLSDESHMLCSMGTLSQQGHDLLQEIARQVVEGSANGRTFVEVTLGPCSGVSECVTTVSVRRASTLVRSSASTASACPGPYDCTAAVSSAGSLPATACAHHDTTTHATSPRILRPMAAAYLYRRRPRRESRRSPALRSSPITARPSS